ncbi:ATP-binding protein [bacterium]|nr:ATP-binding protein [bacterium]
MRARILSGAIRRAMRTFPAVVVTGPRQSGKTTLLKTEFSRTHAYVSLENHDVRMRARDDPNSFLEQHPPPVIIDEIQYVPELLSYIKTRIDEDRKNGRWLLTGSQNFALMQGVSQSLAGRAAVLTLLPLSLSELVGHTDSALEPAAWLKKAQRSPSSDQVPKDLSVDTVILRGLYPEIALNKRVDRQLWCSSYIATYLERDVRNLAAIGDLNQFERFLKLCATRTGQILNLSEMARDIGVSVPTAKRWISILETGYQVYLLYPYYRNIGKRLIKSPKLYFGDTALATYLLGIHNRETLLNSPSFGCLFETAVINDFLKRFLNFGRMPALYYLRTRDGLEVDMVLESGQKLHLFEIKTSMTITSSSVPSLLKINHDLKTSIGSSAVISRTAEHFRLNSKVGVYNWARALSL